jgi:hypothetical protein
MRWWALWTLSYVMRAIAVLIMALYAYLWIDAIYQTALNQVSFTPPPAPQALSAIELQFRLFTTIFTVVVAVFGMPFVALLFYAAGQWIQLHIELLNANLMRRKAAYNGKTQSERDADLLQSLKRS